MIHRPRSAGRALTAACLAGAALVLGACRSGPRDFSNENDRLRRELLTAQTELDRLRSANRVLTDELAAERERAGRRAPDADALTLLPRCVDISLGRLSGPVDTGGGSGVDAVDLYLLPADERGRFVQVVGSLTLRADLVPPAPSAGGSRTLATLSLSPAELREAYRSSFSGTHYSVRLPLGADLGSGAGTVVLTLQLDDMVTGSRHELTRAWPVPPARP